MQAIRTGNLCTLIDEQILWLTKPNEKLGAAD